MGSGLDLAGKTTAELEGEAEKGKEIAADGETAQTREARATERSAAAATADKP